MRALSVNKRWQSLGRRRCRHRATRPHPPSLLRATSPRSAAQRRATAAQQRSKPPPGGGLSAPSSPPVEVPYERPASTENRCLPNLRTRALRPARCTALVVQRRRDPLTLASPCIHIYVPRSIARRPCGTWVCLGILTLISPKCSNESLATSRGATQSRQRGRRSVQTCERLRRGSLTWGRRGSVRPPRRRRRSRRRWYSRSSRRNRQARSPRVSTRVSQCAS